MSNENKLEEWGKIFTVYPASVDNLYWLLYLQVREEMEKFYEGFGMESDVIAPPVDELAKYYGIKVEKRSLSSSRDLFKNGISGFLDSYAMDGEQPQTFIFVNDKISYFSARYVIAHEIAHFVMMVRGDQSREPQFCKSTLFSKNYKEKICDIMASFILLPIEEVIKLMYDFCYDKNGVRKETLDSDEWYEHLRYVFKISYNRTLLCYEDIRGLASVMYALIKNGENIDTIFHDKEVKDNWLNKYSLLFK